VQSDAKQWTCSRSLHHSELGPRGMGIHFIVFIFKLTSQAICSRRQTDSHNGAGRWYVMPTAAAITNTRNTEHVSLQFRDHKFW